MIFVVNSIDVTFENDKFDLAIFADRSPPIDWTVAILTSEETPSYVCGTSSKDGVGQSRGSRKIWGYPPELLAMSLERFNMVGSCFRMGL